MTVGAARPRTIRAALAAAACSLLLGCAAPPKAPALRPSTSAEPALRSYAGRMSVRVDAQAADASAAPVTAFTVLFDLTGSVRRGSLALSTPLGTTIAQASWQDDDAQWTDADGRSHAGSIESLTRQAVGTPLPLGALISWLDGKASSELPSQPLPAGSAGFRQLGWTIDLARRSEGLLLITRDEPQKTAIRLRLDTPER